MGQLSSAADHWTDLVCLGLIISKGPGRTTQELGWGLSIFDDLIAACGPKSFDYHEYFLETMLFNLTHDDTATRQACCFGVGIMATNGGPAYHP